MLQNSKTQLKGLTKKKSISNLEQKEFPLNGEKKVFMLGDSLLKKLQRPKITKKLNNGHKEYVRPFFPANMICMIGFMKPFIRTWSYTFPCRNKQPVITTIC